MTQVSINAAIPELLRTTTIVSIRKGPKELGHATAFFFSTANRVYLVTNKHVVTSMPGGLSEQPDALRVRLHTDIGDPKKNADVDIPLSRAGRATWHAHSRADVAVVDIDQDSVRQHVVRWLTRDNFIPSNLVVSPGEDVLVLGYPLGFHDNINNLPIVRSGTVASAYGFDFRGDPAFLINATIHGGMSGGPVFTKSKEGWMDTSNNFHMAPPQQFFLGIQSMRLNAPAGEPEFGIAVVWYARVIDETINLISP